MTTLPQTTPIRMPRPAGQVLTVPSGPVAIAGGPGNQLSAADAMRVIRANAWLIVGLLVASTVLGFAVNMFLDRYYSRYTASGYVQVLPFSSSNPLTPQTNADYQTIATHQRTQVQILKQEALISQVLQNPNSPVRATSWFAQFNGDIPRAKKNLQENFEVAAVPETFIIAAKMSYSIPKDCKTVVDEIVDQALKNQQQNNINKQYDKTIVLNTMKARYEAELRNLQDDLRQRALKLSLDGSMGPGGRVSIKELELNSLVSEQITRNNQLSSAQMAYNTAMEQIKNGQEPPQIASLIDSSPEITMIRNELASTDDALSTLSASGGSSNPTYLRYQQKHQSLTEKEAKSRADLSVKYRTQMAEQLKTAISEQQSALDAVNKKVDGAKSELAELTNNLAAYQTLQTEVAAREEMVRKVTSALDDLATASAATSGDIQWLQRPQIPDLPSFPKLAATLSISIILGLALALGIAFTRELLDTTVRSPRDIAKVGQMNLLGTVPHEDDDPQAAGARLPLVIFEAPHSMTAEQLRQVRTRLQHAASLDTTRSILVTSASPGDGKTTIACNLAAGLALIGRRILLVDGNFRRPDLHKVFGMDNNEGFSTVLAKPEGFGAAVKESQIPNLSVLTTGPKPANTTEMLESQLLTDFIERALQEYDHVIFDSGPILFSSEAVAMAPRVDGVVTVVRAQNNSRGLLTRMRDTLRALKAEHLGVVLNGVRAQGGGYYGRNIKTFYEYQNG
jgi:polysaccharide biosynthesis transport protein